MKEIYTLNLVSKTLPREFITIIVSAKPGTPEWTRLLQADLVRDESRNITYSRQYWGW